MPKIRSSADLRNNYNEISRFCHEYAEPVFITKNGKGDLAVMSIEAYEQLVSRFEGNASQLYQTVGMLTDYIQSVLPILTVDLNRSASSDAMRRQKCDHISGATGSKVGIPDLLQFSGTDTPDGHQLFRLMVQDIQSVLSKSIVDLLCDLRADPLDLT